MSDNAIDTVPTESAVRGYVNRRLGFDQAGAPVSNNIGPKILAQNGSVELTGNLDANNNTIVNIANVNLSDTDGSVAVSRDYVDGKTEYYNRFKNLRDTVVTAPDAGHLLGYTGTKVILIESSSAAGNNFDVGRVLTNSNGSEVYGTIVGETSYYDRTFGSTLQITYYPTAQDFNGGNEVNKYSDNVGTGGVDATPNFAGVPIHTATATVTVTYDSKTNQPTYAISNVGTPGGSADVISGPYEEIINVQEEPFVDDGNGGTEPVSDIGLYIRRTNTTAQDVNVPDDPTAYYNLQINDEVIVNQDVAPDAAILQSKLDMQLATAEAAGPTGSAADLQARSGLASFDSANFEITDGWVGVKDNGISLSEIAQIADQTVIGNNAQGGVAANVTAVSFNNVVNRGGGLLHSDLIGVDFDSSGTANFDALQSTGVLFRSAGSSTDVLDLGATDAITYEVINVTSDGSESSIVKTKSDGGIHANPAGGFNLGQTNIITHSTITSFSNGAGGLMFTSSGGVAAGVDVKYPGNINIGGLVDPDGAGGVEEFDQSELQAGQMSDSRFVASNWAYHSFIEAPDEKGTYTTGISIGDGSGLTSTAEIAIVVAGGTDNILPAKFSSTAIIPSIDGKAGTEGIDIGQADNHYKDVYIHDLIAGGSASLTGGITAQGDLILNDTSDPAVQKFKVTASNGNVDAEGTLDVSGNTTIGGTLEVGGSITLGNDGNGDPLTGDIGSASNPFSDIYGATFSGTAAQAQYADLAENYVADADYEPGTVVVFGGEYEVSVTTKKDDHRVAGVVSTNPAYLMNSHQDGEHVVPVALSGRVPCNVIGPVEKGDILVAAAVQGYAVVNNDAAPGRVIGKALENAPNNTKGTIEIVVGKA